MRTRKIKLNPEQNKIPKSLLSLHRHPDAYKHEIAAAFGVRLYAIQKALKRSGITRKKLRFTRKLTKVFDKYLWNR